jgi:hypothetical protein
MLKSPHILLAGRNPREVRANLAHLLAPAALQALDDDIQLNVQQLYLLGRAHFTFARRLAPRNWRQTVSRSYYAAYNVSKSIRLHVTGTYSTETKDHSRIGDLPESFPTKSTYANQLAVLRQDRNLSDYDHTAGEADLLLGRAATVKMVDSFLRDARLFLRGLGVPL